MKYKILQFLRRIISFDITCYCWLLKLTYLDNCWRRGNLGRFLLLIRLLGGTHHGLCSISGLDRGVVPDLVHQDFLTIYQIYFSNNDHRFISCLNYHYFNVHSSSSITNFSSMIQVSISSIYMIC